MKLKYNFAINEVAGSTVAVPVGNSDCSFNGYIRLNETGAFIFNALKKETTKEQIVDDMLKEYEGATRQEVDETVEEFLDKLREADII